jgi:hypothetical protein
MTTGSMRRSNSSASLDRSASSKIVRGRRSREQSERPLLIECGGSSIRFKAGRSTADEWRRWSRCSRTFRTRECDDLRCVGAERSTRSGSSSRWFTTSRRSPEHVERAERQVHGGAAKRLRGKHRLTMARIDDEALPRCGAPGFSTSSLGRRGG